MVVITGGIGYDVTMGKGWDDSWKVRTGYLTTFEGYSELKEDEVQEMIAGKLSV